MRFDVYRYAATPFVPYVLDVQSDHLSDLQTCMVVPLVPEDGLNKDIIEKLQPAFVVRDERLVLMTTDMTALRRTDLGPWWANVEHPYRQTVIDTIDFLFQGF